MKKLILRLLTFFFHPSTLIFYKKFKGTIIYPSVILRGSRYMLIKNSLIRAHCTFRAYNIKSSETPLVFIENAYFGERCYVSSSGSLKIRNAGFAPSVFIGTYKHGLNKNEKDSNYNIEIDSPKFIGQNVSIFGNVKIGSGVVVGACTVVTKDLDDNCLYVGNPARKIKKYNLETGIYE